jgi:DNA-binding IclR family transcriptional regulator
MPAAPRPSAATATSRRGIQSIEVGGALLRALADEGRPLALKDLAAAAGMAPAKAHAYLVSFGNLGLIEQDATSGRYGLGPLAMQLGLISLQQLEPLALVTPLIEQLAADTGHTFAVMVWGNRGPTVVRVAQPPSAVHVSLRHGTVMSLRGTASGRLFAALLPAPVVRPLLKQEARAEGLRPGADAEFEAVQQAVRKEGLSRVKDVLLPGISALAAPVFDSRGALVLSLTAIGLSASFDSRPGGTLARTVSGAAQALSRRLGHGL